MRIKLPPMIDVLEFADELNNQPAEGLLTDFSRPESKNPVEPIKTDEEVASKRQVEDRHYEISDEKLKELQSLETLRSSGASSQEAGRSFFERQYSDIKQELEDLFGTAKKQLSDEESGLLSKIKDALSYFNKMVNAVGIRTDFLSIRGLINRLNEAAVQVKEDKASAYKLMARSLGLSDARWSTSTDVESEMREYLDNIRNIRLKWPSLSKEIGSVLDVMQRNLPLLKNTELFRSFEDARRYAFFTGKSIGESAQELGSLARMFDLDSSKVLDSALKITAAAEGFNASSGLTVTLDDFREHVKGLATSGLHIGMTLDQSVRQISRFAHAIERGSISLQDIIKLVSGYTKGDPGKAAMAGSLVMKNVSDKAEYAEIVSLLQSASDNPISLARLVETIATRSQRGYAEFGATEKFKDSERLAELLNKALLESIDIEFSRSGLAASSRSMFAEQLMQALGMLDRNKLIEERRSLRSGLDTGIDPGKRGDVIAASARQYAGATQQWRDTIDENQQLSESVVDQLNQLVSLQFQRVADLQDILKTTPPIVQQGLDMLPGPMKKKAEEGLRQLQGAGNSFIENQSPAMIESIKSTAVSAVQTGGGLLDDAGSAITESDTFEYLFELGSDGIDAVYGHLFRGKKDSAISKKEGAR